jgi:monoamine oxidase
MPRGSAVNDNGRIVIVGASLAGLRAAEAMSRVSLMTGHHCPSRYSPDG